MTVTTVSPPTSRWQKTLAYLNRTWPLYVMLIPGLILLGIFNYGPMYGVKIAFQNYNPGLGFDRSPYVGFQNFEFLFKLPQFRLLLRNSLVIAVSKLITLQVSAILLALLLNEVKRIWFRRGINIVLYLPYFLSWVVMGGILLDMLASNGLLGRFLDQFGIKSFLLLGSPKVFPLTVVGTNIWKEVGFAVIIYLAALTGIDPALEEAASVDGANRVGRIWHIVLPGILPTIVLIACLNLGSVLEAGFDQVINLYNPGVYSTGDILDTYVYRAGLISGKYSLAAAVGLFKAVMGFILISISYRLAGKYAGFRIF